MRILHFADLHIGVESYGRPDPETGLSTRLQDALKAYDYLVDYAIEHEVDLVLFSGDAYKSRDPSQTQQREFASRLARLAAAGIPVFLLVGNHDLPNAFGRATALEIFATLSVPGVVVGNRLDSSVVMTRRGPLQILAVPWVRRSAFLASEQYRHLSSDELHEVLQQKITDEYLRPLAAQLDPSVPAVLSGHLSLSTAKPGSERTMMVGQDYVLLQSSVALPGLDYVALGHIHRRQVLSERPPIVYCGSLQPVDFGEDGQEKGFYIVDIDPNLPAGQRVVDYSFVPVPYRRFLTIRADVPAGDPDPTAYVLRTVARHHSDVKDAIVRVIVAMREEQEAAFHEVEVRRALADAHLVAAVAKEVERQQRSRLGATGVEALPPLEALRLYWASRQPPLDERRLVLVMEYAAKLMAADGAGPEVE